MLEEYDFAAERAAMVAEQIVGRGITDTAVIHAMRTVPREHFVLPEYVEFAYSDGPLPIPAEQTISQPYVVALMISLLRLQPEDRVLEVGTGSGYAAAVLSQIAQELYTVERHAELVEYARERLAGLGYDNLFIRHGDGSLGWPEHAPYDGIIVAAGGPKVPQTLREQLAVGGRLVMPVGGRTSQSLVLVERVGQDKFRQKRLQGVRFVPLVGEEGYRQRGH